MLHIITQNLQFFIDKKQISKQITNNDTSNKGIVFIKIVYNKSKSSDLFSRHIY